MNNSKVLIIVPHEDDEINIAGGTILKLKDKAEIKVVYVTNGDLVFNAKDRFKEAIASLKNLGVPKENIIFLGYSDQSYDKKTHLYNTEDLWTAEKGYNKTYGIKGVNEWCFQKHGVHNEFKKSNIVKDIKEVILDYMPDEIICVDLDFHPDHIMTSLCFEKALGEILNEKRNKYNPKVLKTFAYENSYLGKDDFNCVNDYGMFFSVNKNCNLNNNPYYNINDSIRISIGEDSYSKNLFKNKIWKAILKHKSQVLVNHASKMINSNCVYWKRNTNNLLNKAKVAASSSKPEFLNDFLICDTSNVLGGNKNKIVYDKGIWIPEESDTKKEIQISFEKKQYIKYIKLYFGLINDRFIKKISITFDNEIVEYSLSDELVQKIMIERNVKTLVIKILDDKCYNGFSEIEAVENEENYNENFKVIIEESWTNNFIVDETKKYKVTTYPQGCDYKVDTKHLINGEYIDGYLCLNKNSKGYITFINDNKQDVIYINQTKITRKIWIKSYKIIVKCAEVYQKISRKISYIKNRI